MISVVIPTYNRPDSLVKTLTSISKQTFTNYEVIVINDAGEPVEYVLEDFNFTKVYVKHDKNRGSAASRNTGIKVARGKYLTYVDDDDILYPNHFRTLVDMLKNHKVAYTDSYQAIQEKNEEGVYETVDRKVSHSYDVSHTMLLRKNFIPILCVMHARECIVRSGKYDETLRTLEDWDFLIRLSRFYKFNHSKKVTCEYIWRADGSTKSSKRNKQQLDEAVTYIRKKYH